MAAHALPLAAAIQEAMQPESHLNRGKHTKYHLRCLKTLLPNGYQGTDANRMMLAYFNLASLDLLQSLDTCMKDDERAGYIEWIYSCQFPEGGFRAFPGTDFGVERRDRNNEHWDPPNAAGTLFALVNLLMLGDDLQRVNRKNTLAWLKTLQHEDGSFGETIGPNGKPNGGQDMRYAYMCIGVRHILRGVRDQGIPDIDLDKVVRFVIDSQQIDGGIAKSAGHESHAGHVFCGLSILSLLDRLPDAGVLQQGQQSQVDSVVVSQKFLRDTIEWLSARQTIEPAETSDDEDEQEGDTEGGENVREQGVGTINVATIHHLNVLGPASDCLDQDPLNLTEEDLEFAGFNGRCNKIGDTCYSFWVVGALNVVRATHAIDHTANHAYLVGRTQNEYGGFGKTPGLPPDILHSFFGLAAMSLLEEPGLKPIAASLAVSDDIRRLVNQLPWKER